MATKNKKEMQNVFDDSVATKLDWIVDTQLPEGVQLSQIKYIDPAELKINPLNQELFAKESDEYFKSLTLDIKQRGILVPLIAKQDNVLLAGENRLAIARQLKLKKVPVQIILSQLSDQEEVETLAKDNLFRRHISSQQRFKIYMKLYPDFEGSLNQEKRGRSKTPKLTAEIIARDTNQKVEAVRKQLQRYKKKVSSPQKSPSKKSGPTEIRFTITAESFKSGNIKFTEQEKNDTLKLIEELRRRLKLLAQDKPELDRKFKIRLAQEIDEMMLNSQVLEHDIPSNMVEWIKLQRETFDYGKEEVYKAK